MMSEKMEPLLITKIKSILPSTITNYTITTSTKLEGHLSRSSEWTQFPDQGPMKDQIKSYSQSQPDQHKEVTPDDSS